MKLPSAAFSLRLSAKMSSIFAAARGDGNGGDEICHGSLCCSKVRKCNESLVLFRFNRAHVHCIFYSSSGVGIGVENQVRITLDLIPLQ